MLQVTDHAIERYQMHFPQATRRETYLALNQADRLDQNQVRSKLGASKLKRYPNCIYYLDRRGRGVFAVENGVARTYLRTTYSVSDIFRERVRRFMVSEQVLAILGSVNRAHRVLRRSWLIQRVEQAGKDIRTYLDPETQLRVQVTFNDGTAEMTLA